MEDGEYFVEIACSLYRFELRNGLVVVAECATSEYCQLGLWRAMHVDHLSHYLTAPHFKATAEKYYKTKLMSLGFNLEEAERAYRRDIDLRIAKVQQVKAGIEMTKAKLEGLKNV
jgi:hypothetical protein